MQQEYPPNQEYPPFLHIDEEELETTLALADLGVWRLTFDTNEVEFSARGKAHLGCPAEANLTYAMLGEHIISATDGPGKVMAGEGRIVRDIVHRLQESRVYKAEFQVKWPDGSIHWIEAIGTGHYDSQGRLSGVIGLTRDITAYKLADQRQEKFLSMARHELKTPLTTIKGFAQLLRRQLKKLGLADQAETLTKIEEQVDTMTNLINATKDKTAAQAQGQVETKAEGPTIESALPFFLQPDAEQASGESKSGGPSRNDE